MSDQVREDQELDVSTLREAIREVLASFDPCRWRFSGPLTAK
jgi:hypothetical protein